MRQTWLLATTVLLLCAGISALVFYFSSLPTFYKIAVGPPNSDDLKVVTAIAQQLSRDRASVRLRVVVKEGGTRAASEAIDKREADMAIVRRDISMPTQGQVVAIFRKNLAVIVVPAVAAVEPAKPAAPAPPPAPAPRAGAKPAPTAKPEALAAASKAETPTPPKIETIEDLIGKRLGIVGRSESNIELLKVLLRQASISTERIAVLTGDVDSQPNAPDKVNVVRIDPANVGAGIRDRKVRFDAVLSVGPPSSPLTADAIAAVSRDKQAPSFLAIPSAEALAERFPTYEAGEIRAGAFGGSPPRPEENVDTIGVNHYIVAHRDLKEDTIAEFTRLLFTMRPSLAAEAPNAARIEAPDTEKGAQLPVHPGAVAYIDGEVKTFFDRYSDYLYLGLFGLSFLGSGIAALATYSRSGQRSARIKVLEELLEVSRKARKAESPGELDELQDRADRIAAMIVRDVDRNALDSAAMAAFSMAMSQVRYSVSERRAVLHGNGDGSRLTVASA